jgi:hypothetical protein
MWWDRTFCSHELSTERCSPEGAALGLCDGRSARRLFYDTVEQVIVPALEALGLDAATSWAQRTRYAQRWS